MPFVSGKVASTTWSATAQPTEKWRVSLLAELCDTSNMTSGGFQTNEAGLFSAKATCDGPYNGSLGITQGQSLNVTFAVGGGGPSMTIPFRNTDITIETATRNTVARFALTLESNGTFTITP